MNRSELTPLWKVANSNLSSISSTVKAYLLKRVMKDHKLSFSPCSMVGRLDEECLCLCPPMKLLTTNLLNSLKELTVFRGILLNHTRAGPLRVVGKALHIILFGTPWKLQCDQKGHAFHHTNPNKASWTSEAGGDRWWKPWKGSLFGELNLLWGLPFSCSSLSHPQLS